MGCSGTAEEGGGEGSRLISKTARIQPIGARSEVVNVLVPTKAAGSDGGGSATVEQPECGSCRKLESRVRLRPAACILPLYI